MTSQQLLELVVARSGFARMLGPGIVKRALREGGAQVESARPADYLAALPQLEQRMRSYLPAEEANDRIAELRSFLEGLAATQ